jgi:4-alpha-glucanotransferase
MADFNLPGMKILMFAFGEDLPENAYAPHNIVRNSLVYTGTHDNNTVRGWFENEATSTDKQNLQKYVNRELTSREAPWEMIRLSMTSVANTSITPMQDFLGLGQEARMNLPSKKEDNWDWRLDSDVFTQELAKNIYDLTRISGRV